MSGLQGHHALVTGGATGIGFAVASALKGAGADVTLLGRDAARLEAKAAEIGARFVAADVTDEASVTAAFAAAGAVSILVNNAGVAPAKPFLETDPAMWRGTVDVNLTGTYLCARAALPGMLAAGFGRIVNVASTAGLTAYKGVAAYVAAKHGVIGLTRALALEYAKAGVTVNAVCPGYTETEMAAGAIRNVMEKTGRDEAAARKMLASKIPQGRLIQPEEVANAVLWLCLPGSDSVTGQAIPVCGGEVMS